LLASTASIVGIEINGRHRHRGRPVCGSEFVTAPRNDGTELSDSFAARRQPATEQFMRVEIPTDPTKPHQQDAKDAPHSHNGGDNGFIAYDSPWERLADAIRRVTAGRRPKELAQTDLCRAIADGAVKIRCKLKRHTTRFNTSNVLLDGNNFHIPTEIKPEDLDWERSRPLNPWFVRRGSFSIPGNWDLEWIEVCRADVTKALCAAKEQDESTRHASSGTPATTLESQEMSVGPGPGKPGAPGRRRGPPPKKLERVKNAMMNDIQQGQLTQVALVNMIEKTLESKYGVSRDTARKARNAVLSELNSRQIPTIDK